MAVTAMREEYMSLSKVLPSRRDAFQITPSAIILPIITNTVVATSSICTLSYCTSSLDNHDVGVLRWIVLCWTKKMWSSGYPEFHCGQDLFPKYLKLITIAGSSGRPRRISISAPVFFSITSGLQNKSPPVVT